MKARALFVLLMVFFFGSFSAKAETIKLEKGWNASWVARQFTGNKDNFRYFTYRHYQTGKDLNLTNSQTGSLTRQQLLAFDNLLIGTYIDIPDRLITTKPYQAKNETLTEICFLYGGTVNCAKSIKEFNNLKDSEKKIIGTLRIPNTLPVVFPKSQPKIPSFNQNSVEFFSLNGKILKRIYFALFLIGVILVLLVLIFLFRTDLPIYSRSKHRLLSDLAKKFTYEFQDRRINNYVFKGNKVMFSIQHSLSRWEPLAKILIRDLIPNRPNSHLFYEWFENIDPENNEVHRILKKIYHDKSPVSWTCIRGDNSVEINFVFDGEKFKLEKLERENEKRTSATDIRVY